jgi:hypothetical protein
MMFHNNFKVTDLVDNPYLMFSYLDVKGTLMSIYENPLTNF